MRSSAVRYTDENKSNYFPIAGQRGPQSDDTGALTVEEPFLIYPIGDGDDDPEQLIRFVGFVPIPRPVDRAGRAHPGCVDCPGDDQGSPDEPAPGGR